MNKHFYPAIFVKEDIGYSVSFPDIEGCFTQGDTLEEAVEMANESIGLALEDNGNFVYPRASAPQDINTEANEFLMMISFDEIEYRKKNDTKAVKKTLTIPSWLNTVAEREHINFSQLLQRAIKEQLNINV